MLFVLMLEYETYEESDIRVIGVFSSKERALKGLDDLLASEWFIKEGCGWSYNTPTQSHFKIIECGINMLTSLAMLTRVERNKLTAGYGRVV